MKEKKQIGEPHWGTEVVENVAQSITHLQYLIDFLNLCVRADIPSPFWRGVAEHPWQYDSFNLRNQPLCASSRSSFLIEIKGFFVVVTHVWNSRNHSTVGTIWKWMMCGTTLTNWPLQWNYSRVALQYNDLIYLRAPAGEHRILHNINVWNHCSCFDYC